MPLDEWLHYGQFFRGCQPGSIASVAPASGATLIASLESIAYAIESKSAEFPPLFCGMRQGAAAGCALNFEHGRADNEPVAAWPRKGPRPTGDTGKTGVSMSDAAESEKEPCPSPRRCAVIAALLEQHEAEVGVLGRELAALGELIASAGARIGAGFEHLQAEAAQGNARSKAASGWRRIRPDALESSVLQCRDSVAAAVAALQCHDVAAQLAAHLGERVAGLAALAERLAEAACTVCRRREGPRCEPEPAIRPWSWTAVAAGTVELF